MTKINDMLKIQYVPPNFYDFIQLKYDVPVFIGNREFKQSIKIIPIKSKHIKDPHFKDALTAGFLFQIKDSTFYYSGDSYEIPEFILDLINNNFIDYIYQDTCGIDYPENVHFPLEKLKAIIPINYRYKVYCMHLDNNLNKEDILSAGFNLVENKIKNKETIAIYPGSIDPITYGHLNMIKKASQMFDKVIVSVLVNEGKTSVFTMKERVNFIKQCVKDYPNVEVKMFKGLLAEFAKQENANIIIKGLRNVTDFEYELHQGMINKQLNSEIDTTFLIPDIQYQNMSSSVLRAIAGHKGNIDWIAPKEIVKEIKSKYHY
jgi:pantetheine-phosphate adenylyltransferase